MPPPPCKLIVGMDWHGQFTVVCEQRCCNRHQKSRFDPADTRIRRGRATLSWSHDNCGRYSTCCVSKQLVIPCGWNFPSKHNCDGRGTALRVWNWESVNASDGHSASGVGSPTHLGTTGGHARNVANPQSSRRYLSARCKPQVIDGCVASEWGGGGRSVDTYRIM